MGSGVLVVDGDIIVDKGGMNRNGMYLYTFYCLCYIKKRSIYVSEEQ